MSDLHKLYDQQQRIGIDYAGARREVTPHVVRQIDLINQYETVIYSQLDDGNADAVIDAEIAYFNSLEITSFEWKLFDYDQPADLKDRLVAHGFEIGEVEAVLTFDLQALPPRLAQPVTHDVRRVTDPAGLEDVRAIISTVWGDAKEADWLVNAIAYTLREAPDEMSVYVAYIDGVPASYGRIDFHDGSDFAGLWGGSTLEPYRGRGLYTALVTARAQEAIQRGKRYLTIDASPMSRPILEKLGFELLAYSWACEYRKETD